jgi:nicotinate phosphoribosyltransferase
MIRFLYRNWLALLYVIERLFNLPIVRSLADIDLYKLTMLQVALLGSYKGSKKVVNFRDIETEYALKNRDKNMVLPKLIPYKALKKQLDHLFSLRFTSKEIQYLRSLNLFSEQMLEMLPFLQVAGYTLEVENDEYVLRITGNWPNAILNETIQMMILTELAGWYQIREKRLNPFKVWAEGDRRLTEKILKLRKYPKIRFQDFGTRRRFSRLWQFYVLWRLQKELREHNVITSNVNFARKRRMGVSGTFAHEKYMILWGMLKALGESGRKVHNLVLDIWKDFYGDKKLNGRSLLISLTDTFGTDAFLDDISIENITDYDVRHDSNDPFVYARKMIAFWKGLFLNTNEKRIVFSDSLNVDKIIALHLEFRDEIIDLYGWGTDLMNDMGCGIRALNIVIKAVKAMGVYLAKLSDIPGKFTGEFEAVLEAIREFGYPTNNLPAQYLAALEMA